MHILLIDNNDSFTRNLEHLLATSVSGCDVDVQPYENLAQIDLMRPDLIVISPGPGTPAEYPGYSRVFQSSQPILGVCLGMQIINEHRGGTTSRLAGCVHGKTDTIKWHGDERTVARYHSLHVSKVGEGLAVLAMNRDGVPMCVGCEKDRVLGYQFHPESFLTDNGGAFIHDALVFLGLA